MADPTDPDFSAIRSTAGAVDQYANAFRAGQRLARPPSGADPGAISGQTIGSPMHPFDQSVAPPGAGLADANPGMAPSSFSNPIAMLKARLAVVPPPQRQVVVQQAQIQNEQLSHVLIALKASPPQQRLEIAAHMARSSGLLDPSLITQADVSDQGIDGHLAQAMGVEQFLKREELDLQASGADIQPIPQFNPHTGQVD